MHRPSSIVSPRVGPLSDIHSNWFMEEPDMPDTWMTVAEAAISLKVHPRTIERRIAGGKIQAQRSEDGTLQVLIAMPDDAPDTSADNALETVRELAADQVTL